jgi:hypothetical protein
MNACDCDRIVRLEWRRRARLRIDVHADEHCRGEVIVGVGAKHSCTKRTDLGVIASTAERTISTSPGSASRLYADALIDGRHAALPVAHVLRRHAIIAPRFHVASSNLPTYHMTFMWPMWSHCH